MDLVVCRVKVVKIQSNCKSQSKTDQHIQELEIKEQNGEKIHALSSYYETLKLFTFHDKNLMEDLSKIKLIFPYIMSPLIQI